MKYILFILLVPYVVLAEAPGTLEIGELTVVYEELTQIEGGELYYSADALVASAHDYDGNGAFDTWLTYNGEFLEFEAHDNTGDGAPDTFISVTKDGEVIGIEGEGADRFKKPEIVDFSERVDTTGGGFAAAPPNDTTDLVGSLDRVDIPGRGLPLGTILLWLLIIGAAGYWWYRRKNQATLSE